MNFSNILKAYYFYKQMCLLLIFACFLNFPTSFSVNNVFSSNFFSIFV